MLSFTVCTDQGLEGQLLLLRLACSANSHTRQVVLHRQHGRSARLPFDMVLARQHSAALNGAFVTHVEAAAKQQGLRTGDQVCFHVDCLFTQQIRLENF